MTEAPVQPETQRFAFEASAPDPFAEASEQIEVHSGNAAQAPAQYMEAPANATCIGELRPLGQVNSSFIVAVNSEGLWIIDQHVAHERVLFEQHLRARREGE